MINFPRQALYFLAAVFSIILLFEIFLRLGSHRNITPDFHQNNFGIPFVIRSSLDEQLDTFHGYQYPPWVLQTNANHMRNNKNHPYEKPPNTYRIMVLGNSIFLGLGINNNELFSKRLENILNANASETNFEVLNFSGVAWSPLEYYKYLKNEGYKYSPDLVIISRGENELRKKYDKHFSFKKVSWKKMNGVQKLFT